jgi:streptogramin lyase
LWFISTGWGSFAGEVTPSGTVTTFPLPYENGNPLGDYPISIAAGADGNLWFSLSNESIDKMTPSGTITTYTQSDPNGAYKMTAGPDGNVWFTDPGGNAIGLISPTGVIAEVPLPNPNSNPDAIVAGPDGNLWFTELNHIGRITPAGVITEFATPTNGSSMPSITLGPDGNLWFVESDADLIGRITTSGVITEYALPQSTPNNPGYSGAGDHPTAIAAGADGRMWVTDIGASAGMVAVALDQPLSSSYFPAIPDGDLTATGIIGAFHDPDSAAAAGSYTAIISWGDGTLTSGTITATANGNFNVSGTHTYAGTGTSAISVTITDTDNSHDLGGSAIVTGTSYTATTDGGGGVGGDRVGRGHHKKTPHHPTPKPTPHPKPKPKPKPHHPTGSNRKPTNAGSHGGKTVHTKQVVLGGSGLTVGVTTTSLAETPKAPVYDGGGQRR